MTSDRLDMRVEAVYEIMSHRPLPHVPTTLAVSSTTTWVSRGTVFSPTSALSTLTPPTSHRGQTWAASTSLLDSLCECNVKYSFN